MLNPEHFSFREEGGTKNGEEKNEKENREKGKPWSEKFEVDKNQIEAYFTGKEEREAENNKSLCEIDRIELTTPEARKFDFSSLLPKGWHFERIGGYSPKFYMAASHYRKSIAIPEFYRKTKSRWVDEGESLPSPYQEEKRGREVRPWGEIVEWEDIPTLSKSGALMVLLHEIGHAQQKRSRKGEKMREKIEEIEIKEKEEANPVSLTRQEMELYYQYVVMIERDASAYALAKYRELKKEGIDILPEAKTNQQILETVSEGMKAYLERVIHYAHFKELKRELTRKKETTIQRILNQLKKVLDSENGQ